MELKLQQAIVATRAGRTDVAQSLLTQLIQENPDDANAWFLLGHIVNTPDRQARYLQKVIELEPEHAIAKQRLLQIENIPVPAPVIPEQVPIDAPNEASDEETVVEQALDATVPGTVSVAELAANSQPAVDATLEPQNADDERWTQLAGAPIREKPERTVREEATAAAITQDMAQTTKDKTSGEVWLVRILVLMVIVAAIVLGILVLLILV